MGKGDATKAAILSKAISVASVQGLDGLSIGRLAELTGLSKSGLFGHFGSKEALQRAVLEAVVEDFRIRVILPALREPSGIGRLERLFTGWIEWAASEDKTGGCPLLAASFELDDQPGELRDYLAEQQSAWLDCIARIASKAKAEKEFRSDLDVAQFAFEVHSIGLGFSFAYRLLDDRDAAQRAITAFRRLVASATA